MNSELKEKIDLFINDFLEVKEVKQYLLLKQEITNSREIRELENKLKRSQKNMALSLGTSLYEQNKNEYLESKSKYDNHPLIVNFNIVQEEVGYLLKSFKEKLEN